MGIVNVTPDSFSGGLTCNEAIEHAFKLIDDGADMIDIGAESTRPGWTPVSVEEEIDRLIPLIEAIAPSCDIPISVDTMKPDVVQAALDAGADIVNDVYGMRWDGMVDVIASNGVPVIITHIHGDLDTMHNVTMGDDFLLEIKRFFDERIKIALDAGIDRDCIILDPGLGFGKTSEQNIELLKSGSYLYDGYPVLIGASRKRFLMDLYGNRNDESSADAAVAAIENGAHIVRVHDVRTTVGMFKKRV
ncbi:MAG: dihydropteroate synthase [Candidatus Methanomethylophilaceae archaeon]|jgi:dihydropteroate synthase